jgi:hypothetical protein
VLWTVEELKCHGVKWLSTPTLRTPFGGRGRGAIRLPRLQVDLPLEAWRGELEGQGGSLLIPCSLQYHWSPSGKPLNATVCGAIMPSCCTSAEHQE